ncbi:MAG: hypothetical protein LLG08_01400 [Actinomycetia bacterium]|nr:hypothetical protein [Actinomycetes bacterium]
MDDPTVVMRVETACRTGSEGTRGELVGVLAMVENESTTESMLRLLEVDGLSESVASELALRGEPAAREPLIRAIEAARRGHHWDSMHNMEYALSRLDEGEAAE